MIAGVYYIRKNITETIDKKVVCEFFVASSNKKAEVINTSAFFDFIATI
jgi:hypothetical protein